MSQPTLVLTLTVSAKIKFRVRKNSNIRSLGSILAPILWISTVTDQNWQPSFERITLSQIYKMHLD